ncbi:MAG TPA: hemerythrin domain-containing protein [Streptosporangiaceae bacterium]|nr:hemerythrin domain-containing protein [Streptosporangiaceae bacterium]
MTAVSQASRYGLRPGSAVVPGGPVLTLDDEHAVLLGQVAARAEELLAAAARGRWPGTELEALLGYARAEVLHQASEEETLLFPAAASAAATRLARDHARLRACTEFLARSASGEQALSLGGLAAATRDFVCQLERHLMAEEELLAADRALATVPATTALGSHPHGWYPLTEGPVIDLDALPADQATGAAVARLLRLRRGEQVELHSSTDFAPAWREMERLSPGGYGFVVLQDGPDQWRVRVTRRDALT